MENAFIRFEVLPETIPQGTRALPVDHRNAFHIGDLRLVEEFIDNEPCLLPGESADVALGRERTADGGTVI